MVTVEIMGQKLPLDLMEAETAGRYEQALSRYETFVDSFDFKEKALEIGLKATIEAFCHETFECLNAVFGNGTDKKVFGGSCNLNDCAEAMFQLQSVNGANLQAEMQERFSKYLPNRQRSM